jgi:hypothetical protein
MRLILRTLLIVMATVALSASVYGTGGRKHNVGNHNVKDDMDVCDDHHDTVNVQRSEAAKRFARNSDDDPGECDESPDE